MSLRDRFGRLWGRSSENSPRASTEQPSFHGKGAFQETEAHLRPVSEASQQPSLSPRKLHKAASLTFQAFSDSLRSRAQAFYTLSGQAEPDHYERPEPRTPKRSPRRSAIWSSVRSRCSHSRSTRQGTITPELEPSSPTETILSHIGPAPKLDMDIPSSSLRDAPEDDDVTTPPMTLDQSPMRRLTPISKAAAHHKPYQPWPSPHAQLRALSIGKTNPRSAAAAIDSTVTRQISLAQKEVNSEDPLSNRMVIPQEAVVEVQEEKLEIVNDRSPGGNTFSDDTGYASDTESDTGTSNVNPSTTRTSVSEPPSLLGAPKYSNRVSESTAQSNEDFQGTFWPASKVIRNSKGSSRSLTGVGALALATEPSHEQVNQFSDEKGSCPTSASSSEDNLLGGFYTTVVKPEKRCVPSEQYEADTKANKSSPVTASMGSRAFWGLAQADRARRYAALHLDHDMDSSTDEDSDFGVELTTSPSLPYARLANEKIDEQVKRSHDVGRAPQNDQEQRSLRRNPSVGSLTVSKEGGKNTLAPFQLQSSDDPSHGTRATLVVSVDDYLESEPHRLRLLDSNTDFVLKKTSSEQDAGKPKDSFLITRRLNLEDPFEATVANFGCPSSDLTMHPNRSVIDLAGKDDFQCDPHQRDMTAASSVRIGRGPASSARPQISNLPIRIKHVRQTSGLVNEIRKDSVVEQGAEDRDGKAENEAMNAMTAFFDSLEEGSVKANIIKRNPSERASPPPRTTRSVSFTLPDHWGKPIRHRSSSVRSRPTTTNGGVPLHARRLSSQEFEGRTSSPLLSGKRTPSPSNPSPRLRRGRSSRRSSSGSGRRRKSRVLSELPSRRYRDLYSSGSYTSKSDQNSDFRTPSWASSATNASFNERMWLEAHYERLEEQIARDGARDQPNEGRQRLADVSMVKRRHELAREATIERLCQFIYRCEQRSEAEEAMENQEETEDGQEEGEEASESQEEAEDGYTKEMFQGN
ncbi:MAG: hypothetical protein Q9170_003203 [Blastenia crenularia]